MSAIEFKDVKKTFKDGDTMIEALKETNFSVEKGEFVAIIGPSGSGKSTFLTIAGGLQAPTAGEVLINDQPFSDQKEKNRAKLRFKEIGFILQASNLVPFLTVKKQLKLVDKVSKENKTQSAQDLFTQSESINCKTNTPKISPVVNVNGWRSLELCIMTQQLFWRMNQQPVWIPKKPMK